VTEDGLYVIVSGGVAGSTVPVARDMGPANPFKLERVTVAVPVEPDENEIEVGLTVKPKSSMTTWIVTTPDRVSGLPRASVVAYVPDTTAT